MLIALNVAIFGLGFVAALATAYKPNYTRSDVIKFIHQLQFVLSKLRNGSVKEATEEIPSLQPISRRSSIDDDDIELLTKRDVEQCFDTSTWQRLAYEDFKTTVLAKGAGLKKFPCIYATMGYRSNDHRYVFLESDDPSEPRNIRLIAPALRTYLRMSRTLGPNNSLVIIGSPPTKQKSVTEYNDSFWAMLRGLRIKDNQPWPSDIPQDTSSGDWAFCFDGEPVFPVSLTPAHQRRWSRHASVPIIALQPKWVLDNLLRETPDAFATATGKVRKLLEEYDQVGVSPDLIDPQQEVRQLCLLDENETVDCPYKDFDR